MFDTPPDLTTRPITTAELRHRGMRPSEIAAAVSEGALLRVRRGRFLPGGAPHRLVEAARLGARLDCISLLSKHGVFVQEHGNLHVQVSPGRSRLPRCPDAVVRHWRTTAADPDDAEVPVVEALVRALRCQSPRAAIATLDSAWQLGLVSESDINAVFAQAPRRYRRLRPLLDRRAESGVETLVRLMLRGLGHHASLQVRIDGVGRVDLLVDGWLIIECDSEEHHSSWADQKRDRRRDQAAAVRGYATYRPIAEDILWHSDEVRAAIVGLLSGRATLSR